MNGAGDLAMLGRAMGGLIVVLVLAGLAARIARRARGANGTTGLRVIERVGLSRDANLAVIEVSNRMLLLGVTPQGVTMLADLDDAGYRDAQQGAGDLAVELTTPSPTATDRPIPVPTEVALSDHPDLASALRAAGRTSDPSARPSPDTGGPEATGPTGPRTRAEARAQTTRRGRGLVPRPRTPDGTTSAPRVTRSDRTKRVVPQPGGQASGSVLSPRTWRQGIEALRQLTARR